MGNNTFFYVHDDIVEAAKWYKIPLACYDRNKDVYIMQENRLVFVGPRERAISWMRSNDGIFCKSIYPLDRDKNAKII
jgi:hypothetical protein